MPRPPTIFHDIGGISWELDARVAALAERQHGVVARRQLLDLQLSRRAIEHRLSSGRLHRLHPGVYAVGHAALGERGTWMAAVLAGGPSAVLSHRAAATLLGLRQAARRQVDVTVPSWRASRPAIRFHVSPVPADERIVRDGIPVTTPARTIVDLAAVAPPREVRRALHEAEVLRLAAGAPLAAVLARAPRRPGARLVRAIVAEGADGVGVTRSELEERFLALVDRAGLPRPRTNVRLAAGARALEVDCAWDAARLVVELDGHAFHAPRAAFERDRARDRALVAAGWRVVRVTWRQLRDEPAAVAADVRSALGRRA